MRLIRASRGAPHTTSPPALTTRARPSSRPHLAFTQKWRIAQKRPFRHHEDETSSNTRPTRGELALRSELLAHSLELRVARRLRSALRRRHAAIREQGRTGERGFRPLRTPVTPSAKPTPSTTSTPSPPSPPTPTPAAHSTTHCSSDSLDSSGPPQELGPQECQRETDPRTEAVCVCVRVSGAGGGA